MDRPVFSSQPPESRPSSSAEDSVSESSTSGRKRSHGEIAGEGHEPQVSDRADSLDSASESWKGWAELENDPLIFTKLLREWGVPDVTVEEVIPLDSVLDKDSGSVLGLIFLSRWTAQEADDDSTDFPEDFWFANQISTYSCATLALMNIVNNRPDLDLGPQLNDFRGRTIGLSPKDRGLELDSFSFIKDVHNSFSRQLDRMIVDLKLKEDFQAATKKRAAHKKRKGKKKKKKRKSFNYEEDENAFHFVAYVSTEGQVWRMDGTEPRPRLLGTFADDEHWLHLTIADIQRQLEGPDANDMEFSLLSLSHGKNSSFDTRDEQRVERMKEDWSPLFAHLIRLHAEKGDLVELIPSA